MNEITNDLPARSPANLSGDLEFYLQYDAAWRRETYAYFQDLMRSYRAALFGLTPGELAALPCRGNEQ